MWYPEDGIFPWEFSCGQLWILHFCFMSLLRLKRLTCSNYRGSAVSILVFFTKLVWYLIGKDPDSGKDCRGEEKGTTEDETVGWHHWLNGHEFEQAPGVGDGQESLVCCSPWGHRVTYNWVTELNGQLHHAYTKLVLSKMLIIPVSDVFAQVKTHFLKILCRCSSDIHLPSHYRTLKWATLHSSKCRRCH